MAGFCIVAQQTELLMSHTEQDRVRSRGLGSLFSNRLNKYEFRMDGRVGIFLSAQTMLNTLSGIMRMSESVGVLRYSWAQGLQQHRPTSTWTLTL